MKQFFFCCLLIISLYNSVKAQDISNPNRVALKFAPASIAAGKITFGGEYNFNYRNSVTFLAGIPFDKMRTITFDGKKSDVTSKAFSLMAGYRYYLGEKTMSGFYVEPYFKYLKHESNGLLNAELQGQNAIFDSHSKYEAIGLGAQLGVQIIIAKLVVFDFFFIGPEANSATFASLSTDITDNIAWDFADAKEAEEQIKDVLKDIPIVGDKVAVKVDTGKKTVATAFSGFVPGLRVGASVGIRF